MNVFFQHLTEKGKEEKKEEEEELEPTIKILRQLTMQLQRIIIFYKYVESQLDISPEYDTTTIDDTMSVKNLSLTLLTSEREVNHVIKLAKMLNNFRGDEVLAETKVKFKDENAFFDFLSCFELGTLKSIGLRKDVKEENVHEICKYASLKTCYHDYIIYYKMRLNVTFSTIDISRMDVLR